MTVKDTLKIDIDLNIIDRATRENFIRLKEFFGGDLQFTLLEDEEIGVGVTNGKTYNIDGKIYGFVGFWSAVGSGGLDFYGNIPYAPIDASVDAGVRTVIEDSNLFIVKLYGNTCKVTGIIFYRKGI